MWCARCDRAGEFLVLEELANPDAAYAVYNSVTALVEGAPTRTYGSREIRGTSGAISLTDELIATAWHSTDKIDIFDRASGDLVRSFRLDDFDGWVGGIELRGDSLYLLTGWEAEVAELIECDARDGTIISRTDTGLTGFVDFNGLSCNWLEERRRGSILAVSDPPLHEMGSPYRDAPGRIPDESGLPNVPRVSQRLTHRAPTVRTVNTAPTAITLRATVHRAATAATQATRPRGRQPVPSS